MNILHLSWKNILNKPLNLVLNLVLFALGVGLISLLLLVNVQLEDKFEKNFAGIDLVIGAKGSPLQLILSSLYHLDAPTGNMPVSEKLFEENMEVVVGATVAKNLNLKLADEFKSSHGLIEDENLVHEDAAPFKVVGILEKTGSVIDQLIVTKTQSIWAVHDEHDHEAEESTEHNEAEHNHDHDEAEHSEDLPLTSYEDKSITSLLVKFKGRNIQALNMARNINENTNFQAATPAIEINRLYTLLGVGEEALKAMALLIIFVSGLSIFISLFSSLRERKYELAVMRTLGARPIAVLGYFCGISLSHGSMVLLADFLEKSYRYDFSAAIFLKEEIYIFGGSLVIGIIAAIIPAFQASKTDIHATLADNKG